MLDLTQAPDGNAKWRAVLKLYEAGLFAQALLLAKQDYDADPEAILEHYTWAWLLSEFGRIDDAKRVLDRIKLPQEDRKHWISNHLSHLLTWHENARKPREGIVLCDQLKAQNQTYAVKALLYKAKFATTLGELPTAEAALLEAAKLEPQNPKVCMALAEHYRTNMQPESALEWVERAIAADSHDGDFQDLKEDLETAIQIREELKQQDAEIDWSEEIDHFEKAGMYASAMVYAQAFFDREGKFVRRLYYASAWKDLQNYSNMKAALEDCEKPCPNDADCKMILALEWYHFYEETCQDEAALAAIDRAIALDPGTTMARIFKGGFLARIGRLQEAEACHLEATRCEGNPDEAWYNIALIRRAQLKFPEAKSAAKKALEIDPDEEDYHLFLEDLEEAMRLWDIPHMSC